jgi:hypothetical protein
VTVTAAGAYNYHSYLKNPQTCLQDRLTGRQIWRMFENRMLRRISGPKIKEGNGEELQNMY